MDYRRYKLLFPPVQPTIREFDFQKFRWGPYTQNAPSNMRPSHWAPTCLGIRGTLNLPPIRSALRCTELRPVSLAQTTSCTTSPITENLSPVAGPKESFTFPEGQSQHHKATIPGPVSVSAWYGHVGIPLSKEIVYGQPNDYILDSACTRNAGIVGKEGLQTNMQLLLLQ